MTLNADLCHNVIREFLYSEDQDLEITTKFMFSGKKPLVLWKNFIENVNLVECSDSKKDNDDCTCYFAQLNWVCV